MYIKFNLEEEAQNALDKAKAIYHELEGDKSLHMANIYKC